MTKKALLGFRVLLLAIIISSCGNMNFDLPYGPKGPRGRAAYDVWKEQVNKGQIDWPKDQVEVSDYLIYIKGPKGDKGEDGLSAYETWKALIKNSDVPNPHVPGEMWKKDKDSQPDFWDFLTGRDGKTPRVGENKNWWIGTTDTGVYAYGTIGKDGLSAYDRWLLDVEAGTAIDNSGNVWPKTKKTLDDFFTYWKGKDGKMGKTPEIGDDGNWWIGTTNTNVPAQGQDGKSAYELWVKDVKEEKVQDNHGKPWPKDKFSKEEYWKYLYGAKGPKGDSAYELWKAEVEKGTVEIPGKPGEAWPAGENSVAHFWKYLTGPAGKNGLSAYELWKKDLYDKFDTPDFLKNHKTGIKWPKEKDKLDHFWEFVRGRDGNDGADGKPGATGQPGNLVEIIKGVPNVVAKYSQQEYGEYVSTLDGSVTYQVYDENGVLAPNAEIEGMPGVADIPGQPFITNDKGEFTIPRDRLPWKADLKDHWGVVKKVTIKGVTKESASNTYVPNQVQLKIVLDTEKPLMVTSYYYFYFRILRKLDPNKEWEDLPSYLPSVTEIKFGAFRVSDHLNPEGTITNIDVKENELFSSREFTRTDQSFVVYAQRYMKENYYKSYNGHKVFWDGRDDNYFTVAQKTPYYGIRVVWEGATLMTPYQIGPKYKKIVLRKFDPATQMFLRVEGEFDYSTMDLNRTCKSKMLSEQISGVGGKKLVRVYPEMYTLEEARKLGVTYAGTHYSAGTISQYSSSNGKLSNHYEPGFAMNTVRLNSLFTVKTNFWTFHSEHHLGKIVKDDTSPSGYKLNKYKPEIPDVVIEYRDN